MGVGGMKVGTLKAVTPGTGVVGVVGGGATKGAGALDGVVAEGSLGLLMMFSKLSSKDQVVERSSKASRRRDSGDPSRLELDGRREGVSSDIVEQGGGPY